jgi:hypothetical protein
VTEGPVNEVCLGLEDELLVVDAEVEQQRSKRSEF